MEAGKGKGWGGMEGGIKRERESREVKHMYTPCDNMSIVIMYKF